MPEKRTTKAAPVRRVAPGSKGISKETMQGISAEELQGLSPGYKPKSRAFAGGGHQGGIRVLSRIGERLRGLRCLGEDDSCAVLVPCCDVHTFGMRVPLDIAFVDAAGSVVAVHRRVMPGRRIRHGDARLVVERPSRSGKWLERGDGLFNVSPDRR